MGKVRNNSSETPRTSGGRVMSLNATCRVCNGPSAAHTHYGAVCCYSCRAFFRRGIHRSYQCVQGDGQCQVNSINRTNCKRCRFDRCLLVGMNPNLVDASLKKKNEPGDSITINIKPMKSLLDMTTNGLTEEQLRNIVDPFRLINQLSQELGNHFIIEQHQAHHIPQLNQQQLYQQQQLLQLQREQQQLQIKQEVIEEEHHQDTQRNHHQQYGNDHHNNQARRTQQPIQTADYNHPTNKKSLKDQNKNRKVTEQERGDEELNPLIVPESVEHETEHLLNQLEECDDQLMLIDTQFINEIASMDDESNSASTESAFSQGSLENEADLELNEDLTLPDGTGLVDDSGFEDLLLYPYGSHVDYQLVGLEDDGGEIVELCGVNDKGAKDEIGKDVNDKSSHIENSIQQENISNTGNSAAPVAFANEEDLTYVYPVIEEETLNPIHGVMAEVPIVNNPPTNLTSVSGKEDSCVDPAYIAYIEAYSGIAVSTVLNATQSENQSQTDNTASKTSDPSSTESESAALNTTTLVGKIPQGSDDNLDNQDDAPDVGCDDNYVDNDAICIQDNSFHNKQYSWVTCENNNNGRSMPADKMIATPSPSRQQGQITCRLYTNSSVPLSTNYTSPSQKATTTNSFHPYSSDTGETGPRCKMKPTCLTYRENPGYLPRQLNRESVTTPAQTLSPHHNYPIHSLYPTYTQVLPTISPQRRHMDFVPIPYGGGQSFLYNDGNSSSHNGGFTSFGHGGRLTIGQQRRPTNMFLQQRNSKMK